MSKRSLSLGSAEQPTPKKRKIQNYYNFIRDWVSATAAENGECTVKHFIDIIKSEIPVESNTIHSILKTLEAEKLIFITRPSDESSNELTIYSYSSKERMNFEINSEYIQMKNQLVQWLLVNPVFLGQGAATNFIAEAIYDCLAPLMALCDGCEYELNSDDPAVDLSLENPVWVRLPHYLEDDVFMEGTCESQGEYRYEMVHKTGFGYSVLCKDHFRCFLCDVQDEVHDRPKICPSSKEFGFQVDCKDANCGFPHWAGWLPTMYGVPRCTTPHITPSKFHVCSKGFVVYCNKCKTIERCTQCNETICQECTVSDNAGQKICVGCNSIKK